MNMKNADTKDISLIERQFTVMVHELDMNMTPSMPSICNYLQEVGISHGMKIISEAGIGSDDLIFVLTRLHVKILKHPAWNETIKIRSWLSPVIDRYAIRNFLIYGKDGSLIGRAINSAVPFSMKDRKGGSLPPDMSRVQSRDDEHALPHTFEKINSIDTPDYDKKIEVRYSDCDLYRHVNNTRYISWCIDTIPAEYILNHTLHEIDINFRAEGNNGDELVCRAMKGPVEGAFLHTITDSSGTKDLVRMTSLWKDRDGSGTGQAAWK